MARHSPDGLTQRLKREMPATRASVRTAVKGLAKQGVKEKDIAHAAGWSQSYLSQFISETETEKNPLPAKVGNLIGALHLLASESAGLQSVRDEIETIATRYRIRLAPLANPAQPISSGAPNCVTRAQIDDFIRNWIASPGAYFFDGAPSVGLSSALLRGEQLLRAYGYKVCRFSARDDLLVAGLIERSQTGITGAIAAKMLSSEDPLGLGVYAVEKIIIDCLKSAPAPGYALVLDDVDGIADHDAMELASMLRAWKNRRAAGEAGYRTVTVWSAYTSNVVSPKARSWYEPDASTVVRWFTEEEGELDALAQAFAPRAMQNGAEQNWVGDVSRKALDYFGGQPQLSHLFLWDRSRDGKVDFPNPHEHVPTGAYAEHLDRLSREMIMLLGINLARDAIASLAKEAEIPTFLIPHLIERLRLCNTVDGAWSAAYYGKHLPASLERRIAAIEVAASRESRT